MIFTKTFTDEELQTILSALEDRLAKLTYMRKFEEFNSYYDQETEKAISLANEIFAYLGTYKDEMETLKESFEGGLL